MQLTVGAEGNYQTKTSNNVCVCVCVCVCGERERERGGGGEKSADDKSKMYIKFHLMSILLRCGLE